MTRLRTYREHFSNRLQSLFPATEVRSFFHILSGHILGLRPAEIALQGDRQLTREEEERFDYALQQLQTEMPIQYIVGHTEFYGLELTVAPGVLIPRPETEELVDWVLASITSKSPAILDLGTGSGCIAVTLAQKLPQSAVTALDISEKALAVACQNAEINRVVVRFLRQDILALDCLDKRYDIIVSNPPYVTEKEKAAMHNNVLRHEPHRALFVPDGNPLRFYRHITDLSKTSLNPGGQLFFEINEVYGKAVCELLEDKGFRDVTLKQDVFGKERMVRGTIE